MKYNVFISSKSEDYHLAEQVYVFLRQKGLKVFLASQELDRMGEAQYADMIDEALDHTTHMIVVASSIEHINSEWVKYEWSTFSNDLKSGYRSGNLLNILTDDIQPKKLPPSLRHKQSFSFLDYKDHILSYLQEDENALAVKLEEARREISLLKASLSKMENKLQMLNKELEKEKAISHQRLDIINSLSKKASEKKQESMQQSDGYIIQIVDSYLLVSQITRILGKFGIKTTSEQLNSLRHRDSCDFSLDTLSNSIKIKKELENLGVKVVIKEIK